MNDTDQITDPEIEARVGTVICDKYRVDSVLGQGGMGAVYAATNTAIGKRVALKFLSRDPARDVSAVRRFQREAEAASTVESAHIVQIFDSGTLDDGTPFLVMELLRGEDLRSRLNREGRLDVAVTVHVCSQVLKALARAHEAGIVHRDLKPDNIFLCERDDDPVFVKLVDFGISKLARANTADTLTRRGTVMGTAFYMSPEQAQAFSDIDGRADLFSLGTILYEALAGRPPHTASTYEAVLVRICTKDAEDVRTHAPDVPEALAEVITKAIARDREHRFQSAQEFLTALAQAIPGLVRTASLPQRGGKDGTLLSTPEERHETPASYDERFATAQGTALRSRTFEATRQRRRAWVTGGVMGLAGFAVTAFLIARNSAQKPEAHPAISLQPTAEGDSLANTTTSAEASSTEPVVSAAPSASHPPSVTPVPESSALPAQAAPVEAKRGDAISKRAGLTGTETSSKTSQAGTSHGAKSVGNSGPSTSPTRRASTKGNGSNSKPADESGVAGSLKLKTSGP